MKNSTFERIVGAHTIPLSCKQWLSTKNILIKKGDRDFTHQSVPDVGLIKNVRLMLPAAEREAETGANFYEAFQAQPAKPSAGKFFQ